MSVALLGTSGYLVYDKGFRTAGKEPVKLASNTEEKKMIVLQGRFTVYVPKFSRRSCKKDEKQGENQLLI